jgi:hypothetical protein
VRGPYTRDEHARIECSLSYCHYLTLFITSVPAGLARWAGLLVLTRELLPLLPLLLPLLLVVVVAVGHRARHARCRAPSTAPDGGGGGGWKEWIGLVHGIADRAVGAARSTRSGPCLGLGPARGRSTGPAAGGKEVPLVRLGH